MKRMTIRALAVLLALSLALLAGCTVRADVSSSAPAVTPTPAPVATPEPTPVPSVLVDTVWEISGAEQDGKTIDPAVLKEALGGEISYTFFADGSLKVIAGEKSGEGSWSEKDGAVTIAVGGSSSELQLQDGKLIMEQADTGIRVELSER